MKYKGISNAIYLHTQIRHLIICSKEEQRQVPNHSCPCAEWLCLFVYLCMFVAAAWSKNGKPVTALLMSQYLVNIFIHCVNKSTVCVVEAEVTGRQIPPTKFQFGFHIQTVFHYGLHKHPWIHSEHPSCLIFCADTHEYLQISVLLLNRKDPWVE